MWRRPAVLCAPDRVRDQGAARGLAQLPVTGVFPEQAVGAAGRELPFDPTSNRVGVFVHVKSEREGPDAHLIPDESVLFVAFQNFDAGNPR